MRPGLSRVSEKKIQYNGYPLTQTCNSKMIKWPEAETEVELGGSLPPASVERVTLTIKNYWYVDI